MSKLWRRTACLLLGLVVGGCSVTSAESPSTTLAPLQAVVPTTTTVAAAPAPDVIGYVSAVSDGTHFQLQVVTTIMPEVLAHVQTPDPASCEGGEARNLLASIIFGHKVRIDHTGTVWLVDPAGDQDVASIMVAYGYAKATDAVYADLDSQSPDLDCSSTTTSTTVVPMVVIPKVTVPRPKVTTVKPLTAVTDGPGATDTPVPEPSPLETLPPETVLAPPNAQPERPKDTEAPMVTPKATDPATSPAATDGPVTPRTPRKPKLPDVPTSSG